MQVDRTFAGLQAEFHSRGIGRFFGATFLLVWLIIWAVGEGLVAWFLVVGAKSLLTGTPPEPGRAPLAFCW